MLLVVHCLRLFVSKFMEMEPTAFESKVYEALCRVPRGKVLTYKTLGEAVGCGSGQAIGNAMRRNPFAPEVPCHRVIPATLKLGGFMGDVIGEKIERKRKLLEAEGVRFDDGGKLVDVGCLLDEVPGEFRVLNFRVVTVEGCELDIESVHSQVNIILATFDAKLVKDTEIHGKGGWSIWINMNENKIDSIIEALVSGGFRPVL